MRSSKHQVHQSLFLDGFSVGADGKSCRPVVGLSIDEFSRAIVARHVGMPSTTEGAPR